MTKAAVSVLVPTYNRASYIEECIDSLLIQTEPPLEILVIDDGSNDDTAARVARYGDRITYLRKENGGKASAINFAMSKARGEYIWLFDDDDVALPHSIEVRTNVLNGNPELGFVFSGHYWGHDGPAGKILRGDVYHLPEVADQEVFRELMKGCYFTLQGILARKRVYATVGEFDESLIRAQDYDMMIRMARQFSCSAVRCPSFVFRRHDGHRGPQFSRHEAKDRQEMFRRYDGIIGRKIRAALALDEYLVPAAPVAGDDKALRAALFSRMAVMASKGLIPEMIEDLELALQAGGNMTCLSESETAACAAAVCLGYSYSAIADDSRGFRKSVMRLLPLPGGVQACRALGFGLVRRAKSYPSSIRSRLDSVWLGLDLLRLAGCGSVWSRSRRATGR